MSVTFSPVTIEPMPEALVAEGYPSMCFAHQESDLDVNMSNANASELLSLLGFPRDEDGDLAGSVAPDEFLGRVLVALGTASDPALPGYTTGGDGRALVHEMPRPAGYLGMRLSQLHDLAVMCQAEGWLVGWA